MWQLIQDNFISNYHEYLGDLHHMLVALSKIQTFVFSWTPLIYRYANLVQLTTARLAEPVSLSGPVQEVA